MFLHDASEMRTLTYSQAISRQTEVSHSNVLNPDGGFAVAPESTPFIDLENHG